VYRPSYLEVKLRHEELIREAKKQRLVASLKQSAPRRRWTAPSFSLRVADMRPAI
jgi:hypothetical protein